MNVYFFITLSLLAFGCFDPSNVNKQLEPIEPYTSPMVLQDSLGKTIESRFPAPEGFQRTDDSSESFAYFLRTLPLKPLNSPVKLYNGSQKVNQGAHLAVVDLDVGKKDLHQCADAVMRLRADYLRSIGREDDIHFNFTNGMQVDYAQWKKGKRIKIDGNRTYWIDKYPPSNSQDTYWAYLEQIFMYAGTLSLSKELQSKPINDLVVGDVFIQGGSPGHAVIVVDFIHNQSNGEKKFMLAQSYMPAQEIHILKAPGEEDSPWYRLPKNGILNTPEWTFYSSDLKSF
jgi:hypothetical protein